MPVNLLATKLHVPVSPTRAVDRQRLIDRLDASGPRRLTLVSAPAGFGKSTLLGAWVARSGTRAAWLSLEPEDGEPIRFLTYLLAALRTVEPDLADGVWEAVHAAQPPPLDTLWTALLNALAVLPERLVLVLDDYHVVDSDVVDQAIGALLENLPPTLGLVIATREDPHLPLARLRAGGQLVEVRAADLRFTSAEATAFLNEAMGLDLLPPQIVALETRTEGWAAGLQLAALSLQSTHDATDFIRSFTGSHRFIMDYLVEEVLTHQPEGLQTFMLRTSILDRVCGSLCDAVLEAPAGSGQVALAEIERANLFIVPLDDERRWYRYHHLFAELLRQRRQHLPGAPADDHARASRWFESQGLDAEAFHHAVVAGDVAQAVRLVEGDGMPLHFKGVVGPVLHWLTALPESTLDANPVLWVMWASALLFVGQLERIEIKLRAAEAHLDEQSSDGRIRDLIGHIASIRATVAVSQHDSAEILRQTNRALDYLHRDNLPVRTATCWALGYAYQLQGDLEAAHQAYLEALSISEATGHGMITLMSTIGLGVTEEAWGQLDQAVEHYERVLRLAGDPAMPVACEAHMGLARIRLGRADLTGAEQAALRGRELARLLPSTDRAIAAELLLARIQLAGGDGDGARANLVRARLQAEQQGFEDLLPELQGLEASAATTGGAVTRSAASAAELLDPLSPRELEVLTLTARGLSNREIGERLFLALSTVKGHQQRIFEKLHVQRRTEAIARARELGLL